MIFWIWATLGIWIITLVYATWTNLPAQTAGNPLTATIWNDLINKVNDIWSRTDGIYGTGGNIGIGTNIVSTFKISTSGSFWLNLKDASEEPYLQAWNCAAEWACLILYKNGWVTRAAEIRWDWSPTYFNDGNVWIWTTAPGTKLTIWVNNVAPIEFLNPSLTTTTKTHKKYLEIKVDWVSYFISLQQ